MTPKDLVKLLKKEGFIFVRQSGSHAIYKKEIGVNMVIVPMHSRDIPKGTLCAILKDAGI